jgi:hypothetical protein
MRTTIRVHGAIYTPHEVIDATHRKPRYRGGGLKLSSLVCPVEIDFSKGREEEQEVEEEKESDFPFPRTPSTAAIAT